MTGRIASWFRDAAIRKVMKHGLTVSTGKAISQILGLASIAILTRRLGPDQFGVLALIRTVASIAESYANFSTWQAVIRYGAVAMAAGRTDDVKAIVKLAMLIDVATAALGALAIVAVAFIVPSAFGWSAHESVLCALYGATVLTRVAGTCDGIYRITRAYRTQAVGDTLQALSPMIAVVVAWQLDCGLDGYVIALICGEVIGNIIDMSVSFFVAAKNGYGGWRRASLVGVRTRFPGIVHFIASTNGQLTVKKTQNELDMIVVGSMLGRAASGLFKLVKQLGKIPALVFMPFEQVVFAELSHCAAAHDYDGFQRLLRRFTAIVMLGALGLWAIAALAANPLVHAVAGEKFLGAVPAVRIYLLAMVVSVGNTPTQRALIALGRPGTVLIFDVATLAVLFATTIAGAYVWGIAGVAGAVLVHKLIQLTWSTVLVSHVLRQRRAGVTAALNVDIATSD